MQPESMSVPPADDVMAFYKAAQQGDTDRIQSFLATPKADNVTLVLEGFWTAIESNQASAVRLILQHFGSRGTLKENVQKQLTQLTGENMYLAVNPGTTPLHLACTAGGTEVRTLVPHSTRTPIIGKTQDWCKQRHQK